MTENTPGTGTGAETEAPSLLIPCPRCGIVQDFRHISRVISNWESLLPDLIAGPCQRCVEQDIAHVVMRALHSGCLSLTPPYPGAERDAARARLLAQGEASEGEPL